MFTSMATVVGQDFRVGEGDEVLHVSSAVFSGDVLKLVPDTGL